MEGLLWRRVAAQHRCALLYSEELDPLRGGRQLSYRPHTAHPAVWERCEDLLRQELRKGVLDVETHIVSGIDSFAPGYIDRENEVIVGLQTDAPLKRIVNLYGGTRMARSALEQYGYRLDPEIEDHFSQYRKTHNEGVFDAYPERTRKARHAGLLTGLPDAYGRGRIIGDYRRVALYGIDGWWRKKDGTWTPWTAPWTRSASACGRRSRSRSGPWRR